MDNNITSYSTVSIIIALIGFAILIYGLIDISIDSFERSKMKEQAIIDKNNNRVASGSEIEEIVCYNEKTKKYETKINKTAVYYKRLRDRSGL